MKTTTITFSAASVLVISLIIIGTFKTSIVSALTATTTDATSTASDTTTASTSSTSASSTPATTDASSTSVVPPAQTKTPDQSQAQSQPSSGAKPTLKLVHVAGTKYIDYFTDGTKTYSFPGNPDIDSNLIKPNAPIPSHGNLKWVSTSGMEAYDTPSGDLEGGDYAQESDGSYISNIPAYTYTDATSSVPIAAHIATSKTDPTAATSQ
jgi:hypothetical protein